MATTTSPLVTPTCHFLGVVCGTREPIKILGVCIAPLLPTYH
jgi:hypothetical protein